MNILKEKEFAGDSQFVGRGEFRILTDSLRELKLVETIIEYLDSPQCDYDKFEHWVDQELGNIERLNNG